MRDMDAGQGGPTGDGQAAWRRRLEERMRRTQQFLRQEELRRRAEELRRITRMRRSGAPDGG